MKPDVLTDDPDLTAWAEVGLHDLQAFVDRRQAFNTYYEQRPETDPPYHGEPLRLSYIPRPSA
jgi:hypothetical protein